MLERLKKLSQSLVWKIIFYVGVTLMLAVAAWAFFNIRHYKTKTLDNIVSEGDRLSQAIRLGTHYAMMFNSRDDINQIITNIGKLEEIAHLRIYNKSGQIKFSNLSDEIGSETGIKAEACDICHHSDPPLVQLPLSKRKRFFSSGKNRFMGVISPIYNEPGCATSDCHEHPKGKKVLGALDVEISLTKTEKEIEVYQNWLVALALFVFLMTSTIIFFVFSRLFINPVNELIDGTKKIAGGEYEVLNEYPASDEIGHLAKAINRMGKEIGEKQHELKKQKDEYQNLFELVPCIITVQDRNYRLLGYNQEFSKRFNPKPGDFCFSAYKGRTKKCEICPVEKTFEDGLSHYSEETGVNRDGSIKHWIVKTAPMKDDEGNIIGAMEINLDITHRKELEVKLEQSEKKYYAIFNNIPNPVFVLDEKELIIRDCNESVEKIYGYGKSEIVGTPFLSLFPESERDKFAEKIRAIRELNQVRQMKKNGEGLFVNIRISPSEYPGRRVLLVTTSDITERLETEMQLIQAGKMATLGEMATGVAHELNQPLSVIKTASSFLKRKVSRKERIRDDILLTMSREIETHVDRASNIINHMREFGRKSDITMEEVQVNDIIKRAFEIFRQQLKLREIEVIWDLEEHLPKIMGEAGRLEQVFINLLINARDAIEEKWKMSGKDVKETKAITLKSHSKPGEIVVEVRDTGAGIPPAIASKIFEPFFTTKKVGEGTGLGLSISYGIIQDFRGSISVHSEDGQGTCFTITFPKANDT